MNIARDARSPASDSQKKIVFDGRWVGSHGIGRFATEIAKRGQYEIGSFEGSPAGPLDPLKLSLALRRYPADVLFFSPGYNFPLFPFKNGILTVHDLNHIDRPENSSALKRLYYRFFLASACRRAKAVLTVSEFSRRRIIDYFNVPEDKVINVGNGISSGFSDNGPAYSPGYTYFLCVSNRKGHKNEPRVFESFAAAALPESVRLVLTGASTPELEALIDKLGMKARVVFLGRIEEDEFPALYRGAIGLVFPSLYEGFGLPVVEAMACGVPVITSSTTSLPEVAGEAALLVDPESVEQISAAIRRLYESPELRAELRGLGLHQATKFTWDGVYSRIAGVVGNVLNSRKKD